MAVKGAASKAIIAEKILETFSGAFAYNDGKEIRIPCIEEGAEVQIKVTLTAAKTNVNADGDMFVEAPAEVAVEESTPASAQITAEENANIKKMAELLNKF